jgi:hypothetical protein
MRISLATRAARACAAAPLVFSVSLLSLSLAPSYARTGGVGGASFAHLGLGSGHFQRFARRGFNQRVDFDRFGFHRFRANCFGLSGAACNRFSFDRFGNQLVIGGWGWGGWSGFPVPAAASGPIIVGDGAPVIINIGADPALGNAAARYGGGCVIHKLIYDSNGTYVGERQTPQC